MFFELNCNFYPKFFYKEDVDLYLKSKLADKLATKLKNLLLVYRDNFQHAQELDRKITLKI